MSEWVQDKHGYREASLLEIKLPEELKGSCSDIEPLLSEILPAKYYIYLPIMWTDPLTL